MSSGRFMMIAVPYEVGANGQPNRESTWMQLVQAAAPACESTARFEIPELRVGTLDSLVSLSEALQKDDLFVEQLVKKLASQLRTLLNNDQAKVLESLNAEGKVLKAYLSTFRWDSAKYNTALQADALRMDMNKKMTEIADELKTKMLSFSKIKSKLEQYDRKAKGNLMVRDVSDLVTKDMFVESEVLVTLLVVLPSAKEGEWVSTYERLCEYIVPRSSQKVQANDKDYCMYTCTMFQRVTQDFKDACRERGFNVKDFVFDQEKADAETKAMGEMKLDMKKKYNHLVKWCQTMFSEAFIGWAHMKALRLFVEAVLRYGLPVNFQCAFLEAKGKGFDRKLMATLASTYAHLDKTGFKADDDSGSKKKGSDGPNPATLGIQDYDPYVNYWMELGEYLGIERVGRR